MWPSRTRSWPIFQNANLDLLISQQIIPERFFFLTYFPWFRLQRCRDWNQWGSNILKLYSSIRKDHSNRLSESTSIKVIQFVRHFDFWQKDWKSLETLILSSERLTQLMLCKWKKRRLALDYMQNCTWSRIFCMCITTITIQFCICHIMTFISLTVTFTETKTMSLLSVIHSKPFLILTKNLTDNKTKIIKS